MPDIIIYSFAVAICFFLGFLVLFYIPVNKRGNFWFGIFLISIGFALLSKAVWVENLDAQYPYITPFSELSRLIIAPSFYLGVWHYTHLNTKNTKELVFHLLPAFAFILLVSLPYFFSNATITDVLNEPASTYVGYAIRAIIPIQVVAYWIFSFRLLNRHRRLVELYASQRIGKDLAWLRGVLFSVLALIVLFIADLAGNTVSDSISAYVYLAIVLFIGYHLLKQQAVFLEQEEDNRELEQVICQEQSPTIQETIPRLTAEELVYFRLKLDAMLETEEVFTDTNLDLAKLSQKVGLSMNDLSFLINREYGQNFYSLINSYRVEKVKQLLSQDDYRHLTILGIAYEAGFTSKSTFNNVFKKATGLTPSAYLKSIKEV